MRPVTSLPHSEGGCQGEVIQNPFTCETVGIVSGQLLSSPLWRTPQHCRQERIIPADSALSPAETGIGMLSGCVLVSARKTVLSNSWRRMRCRSRLSRSAGRATRK